jgi:2'-5' RNA ligase
MFVALNLPQATRRALWEAIEPLRRDALPVRWVEPDAIHVTLKFLGEAPETRAGELKDALRRAAGGAPPMPLTLQGFGAFPEVTRPRVLWAGIDAEPALELLQHAVEREFAPLGFPTEARPFHPHVTLARAARDARAPAFRGLEDRFETLRFTETVMIESLDLMRSRPSPRGASYEVFHGERLR